MARETLQAWAKRFAADLSVDGEAIPLDRVLRKHLQALSRLRADGLTWTSVANAIRQAGGRRRNGMPFTAAQLRADVSRLSRQQAAGTPSQFRSPVVAEAVRSAAIDDNPPGPIQRPLVDRASAGLRASVPPPPFVSDDVSDAELMRVRARLTRT